MGQAVEQRSGYLRVHETGSRPTCQPCEKIGQPPAPFHPTPRCRAGPNLLAMVLFETSGKHQPLNRQAERHATEGVEISLSTLDDWVGACAAALEPIHALIRTHVLGADRLHGPSRQICPANRLPGQWMPATLSRIDCGRTSARPSRPCSKRSWPSFPAGFVMVEATALRRALATGTWSGSGHRPVKTGLAALATGTGSGSSQAPLAPRRCGCRASGSRMKLAR